MGFIFVAAPLLITKAGLYLMQLRVLYRSSCGCGDADLRYISVVGGLVCGVF